MHRHHYDLFETIKFALHSFFGELTEKEQEKFDRMTAEKGVWSDPGLLKKENLVAKLKEVPIFDTEKAYRQFRIHTDKSKRLQIRHFIRIAASFIIPLIVCAGILRFLQEDETLVGTPLQIRSVTSVATVTLGDGRKIVLGDTTGILTEKNGTLITSEAGKIVYREGNENNTQLIYNELNVPRGGEYSLLLSDGSKIWLNSDSKLRYPVSFTTQKREIYLSGEAYFEVAENKEKPFLVHTSMGVIQVLGTVFNVRDYCDEKRVVTTLVNGSVNYRNHRLPERATILQPGYQVSDDPDEKQLQIQPVNLKEFTGWKDGLYIFNNLTLGQMMKTIERNYDVSVFFTREQIKNLRFSGDLKKYEQIENFLKFIEIGGDVAFTIKGKTITVNQK